MKSRANFAAHNNFYQSSGVLMAENLANSRSKRNTLIRVWHYSK